MKLAAEGFQTNQTNKKGAYILIFLSSYAGFFYYNQGEDYAPHITATSPRFENPAASLQFYQSYNLKSLVVC